MDVVLNNPDKITILHKGEDASREEYSIFKNCVATDRILQVLETGNIGQIDICGLAGDVCVADTIRDDLVLKLPPMINVLTDYTSSIDGGKTLNSIISKNKLSCVR